MSEPAGRGPRDVPESSELDRAVTEARDGSASPVYLVAGDLVIAERTAARLAVALAEPSGCQPETHRRPARLTALLDDLRTFSLFASGKVVVVVDSALLADRKAAAGLVADALKVLPLAGGGERLSGAERQAASRLLQALHLFGVAPDVEATRALDELPDWALAGARGGRVTKASAAKRREQLAPLLETARVEGVEGIGDSDLAQVGDAVRRGLPPHQHLVLVERSVVGDHPLVQLLRDRGAVIEVIRVAADRQGWKGVDALVDELTRESGVEIRRDAVHELVRRTLKQDGRASEASVASTARFAGELSKLADLAAGAPITVELVRDSVEDRGDEDVWQLLDDIAAGRSVDAVGRLHRLLDGAGDAVGERLSFLSLLTGFCRQMVAVRGAVQATGAPAEERSYRRFKSDVAPKLQRPVADGLSSPLARLHPFRLHRAYLAASRFSAESLEHLPLTLLETEVALKGESSDAEAALVALVIGLADGGRRPDR